jgi:rhodanese-related sulfurtransferase
LRTRAQERQTIEQVLADARARLSRVSPRQAHREAGEGALLVDIRPQAQRAAEGEIPGAMIVERNVLEWRFDPASAARLPEAGYDLRVIVVCSEGYTSSLAAAALQDLGISRATDMAGGFRAWQLDGLPTSPASRGAADHSSIDHSSIDHSATDHSATDHSATDHSSADHSSAGHSSAS